METTEKKAGNVPGEVNTVLRTRAEAATFLAVTENTVKFLTKNGKLKSFKMGREVRYRINDLNDFLQNN